MYIRNPEIFQGLSRLEIREKCWREIAARELIINHYDGMERALVFTGTTFNTFLQIDRCWYFTYPLINFAGTYLNAIATAITGPLIKFGMHEAFLPEREKIGKEIDA